MARGLLVACLGIALGFGMGARVWAQSDPRGQIKGEPAPSTTSSEVKPSEDAQANSADPFENAKQRTKAEVATFGGGCFWSIEAVFEQVPGVKSVVSGFSGGNVPNPSYEMVGTGMTGHAESVQITFDPKVVSYDKLLKIFFAAHDPTTPNRQGDDFGPQYRSVVFFHSEAQKKAAIKYYQDMKARRVYRSPIVTELLPFQEFFPAEPYHQDYFRNHPESDYTQIYIIPKLAKMKTKLK